MVVQHNLTAMNANRMLGITQGTLSKSTEKLSSGYKVNRAADDAAGLSISEKMRKQIRGLTQASLNAEDGISSVQTAEGALTEVHDMLQRMNELANKAANGTNSESDRQTIQDEVDQLLTEIDRVSETTKFNEIYLLKGNAAGTSSAKNVNAHDAGIAGKLVDEGGKTATFELEKALENGDRINIAGTEYTIGEKKVAEASTDGYGKYYTKATLNTALNVTNSEEQIGDKKMQAGDTITVGKVTDDPQDYKTYTLTEKLENKDDGSVYQNGMRIKITDGNGHETTYEIAAAAAAADATNPEKVTAAMMGMKVKEQLEQGHTVTMTKWCDGTAANAMDVNWEIVKKLEDDELAVDKWQTPNTTTKEVDMKTLDAVLTSANLTLADGATAATLTTGVGEDLRAVSLGGVETTFTTGVAMSSEDFAKAVGMLQVGDKMTIQDKIGGGTSYNVEIADATDEREGKYTVEDALKLVNKKDGDIDEVLFDLAEDKKLAGAGTAGQPANKDVFRFLKSIGVQAKVENAAAAPNQNGIAVSVVGSTTPTESADDVITVKEAYEKITKELQKASSIGTDEGSEASVKNNEDGSFTITKGFAVSKDTLFFNLHVGADADMTNKIGVTIDAMSTRQLGIQNLDVVGRDENGKKIDDGGIAATYAIDSISDAISKVSAQRSLLGAVQNRLEHTISNLDNVVENTTAAESQIRDTDMATEMVRYSNANILAQAGQSMLAQANQSNQGVLSLLG